MFGEINPKLSQLIDVTRRPLRGQIPATNLPAAVQNPTLIQTQTPSGVANVDFLTGITNAYSRYGFEITNLVPSGGSALQALFHQGGGFIVSSNYYYATNGLDQAGSGANNAGAAAAFLAVTNGNIATAHPSSILIDLPQPSLITGTSMFWRGFDSTGATSMASSNGGGFLNTTAATDGVRFQISTGTFSATIKLYGYN